MTGIIITCPNCAARVDANASMERAQPRNCHCGECGVDFVFTLAPLAEDIQQAATGAKRSSLYPKGAKFPARYDLMFRNDTGMRRLAETWGEGYERYGADNWMQGFPSSVLLCHALEHIRLYLAGDTTEDHISHGAWNLLTLCWVEEHKPELLDLTIPKQ